VGIPAAADSHLVFACEIDHRRLVWIFGRKRGTNEVVFRFPLPDGRSRMVIPMGKLLHLRNPMSSTESLEWNSLFVDLNGRVRFRESHAVMSALEIENELVILTPAGIARLNGKNDRKWAYNANELIKAGGHSYWGHQGGQLIQLPDKDAIAAWWSPNSDSGVKLLRFQIETGTIL
jgi:hypothetical protein